MVTYRVLPITESVRVVIGIAANHRDKGVRYQPQHKEDLEYG